MTRILYVSLLFLASINLQAQGLNVGLRANAGYRLEPENYSGDGKVKTLSGEHLSVAPEVFLRFEAKRRWAVEASFNQTRNEQVILAGNDFTWWHDTLDSRAVYYDLTLSAQYELSNTQFKKSGLFKGMHHYLGVSFGLLKMKDEVDYYTYNHKPEIVQLNNKAHSFWTGLNYMMALDVGKRVELISGAYFKFSPELMLSIDKAGDYPPPVMQFGLQLGAAYRIF